MVELRDVTGQTQITLVHHRRVVDAFGGMAASRPTACKVEVYFFGMRRNRRLRMTRKAVGAGLVMVHVTARAICLGQQGRSCRVTGGATHASVDDVIEQQ